MAYLRFCVCTYFTSEITEQIVRKFGIGRKRLTDEADVYHM